jgi:hypothetical protein
MLRNYISFIKEQVNSQSLLDSIGAKQVLMGNVIGFNSEKYNDIDDLSKDGDFLRKLDKKGLKRNNTEYSDDCETFLDNNNIKFFLIFKKEESELDPTPEYIVMQSGKNGRWNKINMYEVHGNISNFYDKLSSKTIKITKGTKNYFYRTPNAGNDWKLQNTYNKDGNFKNIMSDQEIQTAVSQTNAKRKVVEQLDIDVVDPYGEEIWDVEEIFEPRFGDIIRCIDDRPSAIRPSQFLHNGNEYEITDIQHRDNGTYVIIRGVPHWWSIRRFVKKIK